MNKTLLHSLLQILNLYHLLFFFLLYDSEYDLSIKFQPGSGLAFYYKGSYMQMTPDNTITIHYGPDETTGV